MKLLALLLISSTVLASDGMQFVHRVRCTEHVGQDTLVAKGTCFEIKARKQQREFLTAYHTIESPRQKVIEIELDNEFQEAKLEKFSTTLDICLLTVPLNPATIMLDWLKLGEDPKPDDKLFMFASLLGDEVKEYRGKLCERYYARSIHCLFDVKNFDHGASGALIVDKVGNCVGMATDGLPATATGAWCLGNNTLDLNSANAFVEALLSNTMLHDKGLFLPVSAIKYFLEVLK